ncbi:cyclin N-terminal domain-containing protein 1 isoform X2 [Nomia melanderi]|uniref:cyclin N-terminal domain-containing protein 1 isoform X2 n=1 Tax=Nomia melanderi TaxID=2448451 RepID=UPI0013043312|nr:uncharacterized protein LOC116432972 isoform X2 [Nomia melanderi]
MDLDGAYIEPLLDEWLKDLQTVIKQEEDLVKANDEFYMPFVVVSVIFKLSDYLNLDSHTRYIAIHLYDKFMCKYFWQVYKVDITNHTDSSWTQVCKKISGQSKLYLVCCLQLASKMDSHSKKLGISQVLSTLQSIDNKTKYNRSIIFSSELTILKMMDFKIPICTSLNCVEVLLAATGLRNTPNMENLSVTLLDLIYLQREKLYSHLQCLAQGHIAKTDQEKRSLMTLESNSLFLAAAVVLCGTFFTNINAQTAKVIASKLSNLVDIEADNIWDMANILLVLAIQE